MLTLVTTVTCRPASRRCNAHVRPATPEPTTTTSVDSAQPGGGPANRRGIRAMSVDQRQVAAHQVADHAGDGLGRIAAEFDDTVVGVHVDDARHVTARGLVVHLR